MGKSVDMLIGSMNGQGGGELRECSVGGAGREWSRVQLLQGDQREWELRKGIWGAELGNWWFKGCRQKIKWNRLFAICYIDQNPEQQQDTPGKPLAEITSSTLFSQRSKLYHQQLDSRSHLPAVSGMSANTRLSHLWMPEPKTHFPFRDSSFWVRVAPVSA